MTRPWRRPWQAGAAAPATTTDQSQPREENAMRTNDSHVAVARLAADVRSALRGRRDRRIWPYALAPLVLVAADAALNGPAVLASDVSALASGLTHAATQGLALITSGGPR